MYASRLLRPERLWRPATGALAVFQPKTTRQKIKPLSSGSSWKRLQGRIMAPRRSPFQSANAFGGGLSRNDGTVPTLRKSNGASGITSGRSSFQYAPLRATSSAPGGCRSAAIAKLFPTCIYRTYEQVAFARAGKTLLVLFSRRRRIGSTPKRAPEAVSTALR